ncbi:hypothetical protein BDY24DRAFT_444306, partial [Mrakia frigida]|uniref:uncharacterized protein n=1 Tax=Mrakia frigida TaxID=29902 RepID=UPI003FCBFAAA
PTLFLLDPVLSNLAAPSTSIPIVSDGHINHIKPSFSLSLTNNHPLQPKLSLSPLFLPPKCPSATPSPKSLLFSGSPLTLVIIWGNTRLLC